MVNYLAKPQPPVDEYYYEEDSCEMNEKMGGFCRMPKAQIRIIGAKVKEIKVGTFGITTERVTMFEMETTTAETTSTK